MVIFGFVLARLRRRPDNTRLDHWLAVAVWVLPVAMLAFGPLHIPVALLVLPLFAGRLLWRLSQGEARQPAAGAVPTLAAAALAAH